MKMISSLLKSMCIAFSMFSKLPMPQFEWKEKDMKYMLVFFPFVGVIIGACTFLWGIFCTSFSINKVCFVLIGTAIPLLLSGGIHVDGFMDTMDALHSYQSREKKLAILQDAHIGAFSVIQLIIYYLLYMGAYAVFEAWRAYALLAFGFWLARILSALGIMYFPCAKKDGLLFTFSGQSDRVKVRVLLYVQLALCSFGLLVISMLTGLVMLLMGGLTLGYYYWKCKKEFGGITGDTSGYFTTLSEGVFVMMIAVGCLVHWI